MTIIAILVLRSIMTSVSRVKFKLENNTFKRNTSSLHQTYRSLMSDFSTYPSFLKLNTYRHLFEFERFGYNSISRMFDSLRSKGPSKQDNVEYINTVSFNSDYSCIALATNKGFKVFTTEPLKLKQQRDLGAPLQFVEMYERSNLLALVGFDHAAFKSNRVALFDDST